MNKENKKLWITVSIGLLLAFSSFVFLPKAIPIHFSAGVVDEYASKVWIFVFPFLQIVLVLISDIKSFKYWCLHCKSVEKTEKQYNMIMFCVILLILVIELAIILMSLFL